MVLPDLEARAADDPSQGTGTGVKRLKETRNLAGIQAENLNPGRTKFVMGLAQ